MNQKLNLNDVFPFGKWKGYDIKMRIIYELSYCIWWMNNIKSHPFSEEVIELIKEEKEFNDYMKKKKKKGSYMTSQDEHMIIIGINGF